MSKSNLGSFALPPKPPSTELSAPVDPPYPGRAIGLGATGPTGPIEKTRPKPKVEQERIAAYIPAALDRQLRIRCAETGLALSAAVQLALEAWLGDKSPKQQVP